MSQAKVDAYKAAKKTRKEDIAKQKKADAVRKIVYWIIAALIVCALAVGLIITFKNMYKQNGGTDQYAQTVYELDDYAGLTEAETSAEE